MPLGVVEMSEWCKSLMLVPKHNGKLKLCLNPGRLDQTLIRPVHRGPTASDIFPELKHVHYLTLIDVSSGYHNLNLEKKSS